MYPTNMLSEAAQLLDPSISLVAVDLIMVQRLGKDRREMNFPEFVGVLAAGRFPDISCVCQLPM